MTYLSLEDEGIFSPGIFHTKSKQVGDDVGPGPGTPNIASLVT